MGSIIRFISEHGTRFALSRAAGAAVGTEQSRRTGEAVDTRVGHGGRECSGSTGGAVTGRCPTAVNTPMIRGTVRAHTALGRGAAVLVLEESFFAGGAVARRISRTIRAVSTGGALLAIGTREWSIPEASRTAGDALALLVTETPQPRKTFRTFDAGGALLGGVADCVLECSWGARNAVTGRVSRTFQTLESRGTRLTWLARDALFAPECSRGARNTGSRFAGTTTDTL